MTQSVDQLHQKVDRFLKLLAEHYRQIPKPVVMAGLEFVGRLNAGLLESHHEATSHLHQQKAEFRRSPLVMAPETAEQFAMID